MTNTRPLRLVPSAIALVLGAVGVLGALSREQPVEAFVGMPAPYRAYWQWVSASVETPAEGLREGLIDVEQQVEFAPRYLRLADLCVAQQQQQACTDVFTRLRPQAVLAQQHRQAALAIVAPTPEAAHTAWAALAAMPRLDPAVARRLFDNGAQDASLNLAAAFEALLAQDSTDAGAAFGLGLFAMAQQDLGRAAPLFQQARRHAINAPDVYRELGRVYFTQGQVDRQEAVLREGVARADSTHSLEAALLLRGNLGLALIRQENGVDEAEAVFRDAARKWAALGDRMRVGLSQYRLGLVAMQRQRYDYALAHADSGLVDLRATNGPSLADALALKGTAQQALFRFSDAEASLAEAVAVAQKAGNTMAELQGVIALTQLQARTGQYEQARRAGLVALETARAKGMADVEIGLRTVLGEAERFSGNLDRAHEQYASALTLARSLGQQTQEVGLYQRLGEVMLEMQAPTEAKEFFDAAARISSNDARVLEGLGRTYYQFGNYAQALRYYDQSLQNTPESATSLRTTLATNKGWALLQQERYAEAAQVLDAAARASSRAPTPERLNLLVARGTAAIELQQYDQALARVAEARQISARAAYRSVDWILDFTAALAYARSGKPREAEVHYRRSINTVEALRDNLFSVQKRAAFVGDKSQVYKQYAAFLMTQGRRAEAFHFAERARARSLADLLLTLRTESALDGSPTARLMESRRRQDAIQQAIEEVPTATGTDATRGASLLQEMRVAKQQYEAARRDLASDTTFAAISKPVTESDTRAMLRSGEALVSFSLGRDIGGMGVPTVAYVFTRGSVKTVRLNVKADELAETVRFFRDGLSNSGRGPGTGWEGAARRLHADLMAPVLRELPSGVQHLHLIPEGMLHYVPFAALLDREGHFLVERYTISVAPSASVLALARQRGREVGDRWRQIVAVADPSGRLPGTRAEVNALETLPGLRVAKLMGAEATRANLQAVAGSADILHLATHGRFVSRSPWNSYLELNGEPLRVGDIEALQLDRPYLVTLSACETALGSGMSSDVPAGEEWVGLNQAFLAAGSPSVLASLWSIDDRASSPFMVDFYRHLLEGRGKAWALAQVQKQYLRSPRYRHPFYWAAFTLTGEPL